MNPTLAIIDTNVIVAGLLTTQSDSPVYRILNAVLTRTFPFLLSLDLVREYRNVLLRPHIRKIHNLTESAVETLLTEIVENGIVLEPEATAIQAPDRGDQHLWQLLLADEKALLVTGDRRLLNNIPEARSIVNPRQFIELFKIQ